MRRELDGRRMHEANLARFARSIMSPARISGDRSGNRGRDDDASLALGFHRRQTCLDRKERPFEIGAEHLVPCLGRELVELRGRKDPGIGTENIDSAELLIAAAAMRCVSAQLETSA